MYLELLLFLSIVMHTGKSHAILEKYLHFQRK